jgi:hypothetical protein
VAAALDYRVPLVNWDAATRQWEVEALALPNVVLDRVITSKGEVIPEADYQVISTFLPPAIKLKEGMSVPDGILYAVLRAKQRFTEAEKLILSTVAGALIAAAASISVALITSSNTRAREMESALADLVREQQKICSPETPALECLRVSLTYLREQDQDLRRIIQGEVGDIRSCSVGTNAENRDCLRLLVATHRAELAEAKSSCKAILGENGEPESCLSNLLSKCITAARDVQ